MSGKARQLLFSVTRKDFRVDTFRSGGKGGQNQNKRDTGVRITHLESGAVGESRTHRTQGQNKKAALERLVQSRKWKAWHRVKTAKVLGQVTMTEEYIDEMMKPKYLKIEVKDEEGRWVSS